MEEYVFPAPRAVVSRLQALADSTYLHASLINNYPKPDKITQNTVDTAQEKHDETVRDCTKTLDGLIKKQEDAIKDLKAQIEELHKREEATPQKLTVAKANGLKHGSTRFFDELPWLPDDDSGVNTLLALRGALKVIDANREGITDTERKIEEMKKTVRREKGWVTTAKEMEKELKRKIEELEGANAAPESQSVRDKRKLAEYDATRKEMTKQSNRLTQELGKFVKDRLGAMIAVEEAGGPVAGNLLNLVELRQFLDIESGDQPKRKTKASKARERGQRRLDEIWGSRDDEGHLIDPESKAGEELLDLIQILFTNIIDDDPLAYTTLTRDSAASRYLVRSFVATLHPKDAMRIRLIDFAGKIDG